MPYVYILECADGSYYVGSTIDLEMRFQQHQAGFGSAYTRRAGRRPVTVVWHAEYARIDEAFAWEKRIQGWSHAKRRALIEGGMDAVIGWSRRERAARRGTTDGSASGEAPG